MAGRGAPGARSWRLGFAGTPEFAATILRALMDAGQTPVVVYTQPDRASGRGRRPQPSPVKQLAEHAQIPLLQPATLRTPGAAAQLEAFELDVLIVAAYGLILPPAILEIPRFGCLNVHASLLPRWRGAAPVERAILAGDRMTGVSIMQMEAGLDTGPVFRRAQWPIDAETRGPELTERLAELGARTLLEVLAELPDMTPEPQDEAQACYAPKLTRADQMLDFSAPAALLERQVRALTGRLPAEFTLDEVRVKVLDAEAVEVTEAAGTHTETLTGTLIRADSRGLWIACGEGALALRQIQLNRGKGRPMDAAAAVNGYAALFRPGRRIS